MGIARAAHYRFHFLHEIHKIYFRFLFLFKWSHTARISHYIYDFQRLTTTTSTSVRRMEHDNFCTNNVYSVRSIPHRKMEQFCRCCCRCRCCWRLTRRKSVLCTMHNVACRYFYGVTYTQCRVAIEPKWNWPVCCWWLQFSIGERNPVWSDSLQIMW